MHLHILGLFLFAVSAIAQNDVADCALSCLNNVSGTNCYQAQWSCLCQSQAFLERTSTCARSNCSNADFNTAISVIKQICSIFSASLTFGPYATASSLASDQIFSTVAIPIPSSLPPVYETTLSTSSGPSNTNTQSRSDVSTNPAASTTSSTSSSASLMTSSRTTSSPAATASTNNGYLLSIKAVMGYTAAIVLAVIGLCF